MSVRNLQRLSRSFHSRVSYHTRTTFSVVQRPTCSVQEARNRALLSVVGKPAFGIWARPDNLQMSRRWSWAERMGLKEWEKVSVTFAGPASSDVAKINAKVGQSVFQNCRENNVELEAFCEGQLACSTCHIVFEQELFDKLPEAKEDELDLLDKAACLTDTSRLGCQVKVSKDFEGAIIRIPEETNNA